MLKYPDQVRWFDELGGCRECSKPAIGKLMGPQNESHGPYCKKCAEKRLRAAKTDRENYKIECEKAGIEP